MLTCPFLHVFAASRAAICFSRCSAASAFAVNLACSLCSFCSCRWTRRRSLSRFRSFTSSCRRSAFSTFSHSFACLFSRRSSCRRAFSASFSFFSGSRSSFAAAFEFATAVRDDSRACAVRCWEACLRDGWGFSRAASAVGNPRKRRKVCWFR